MLHCGIKWYKIEIKWDRVVNLSIPLWVSKVGSDLSLMGFL